jgi:glutamine amidotransferase
MVAVVQYNAGNIRSVINALERLAVPCMLTDRPEEIMKSELVIFPGVGEASSTMAYLRSKRLDEVIRGLKQPVLGICLGMQLMCRHSEENNTEGLGIIDAGVRRFPASEAFKVPHIGWNTINDPTDWLANLGASSYAYFVHSYYVPVCSETIAACTHGLAFSAALRKDNFYAVQFHPEKSAAVGERVLNSFLAL